MFGHRRSTGRSTVILAWKLHADIPLNNNAECDLIMHSLKREQAQNTIYSAVVGWCQ